MTSGSGVDRARRTSRHGVLPRRAVNRASDATTSRPRPHAPLRADRTLARRAAHMVKTLQEFGQMLLLLVGAVVLLGAVAHALGWLLGRRRAARLVWRAWNLLGVLFLGVGVLSMAYAWWVLGLQSGLGSLLLGLGLLLASAGLWMLVPV